MHLVADGETPCRQRSAKKWDFHVCLGNYQTCQSTETFNPELLKNKSFLTFTGQWSRAHPNMAPLWKFLKVLFVVFRRFERDGDYFICCWRTYTFRRWLVIKLKCEVQQSQVLHLHLHWTVCALDGLCELWGAQPSPWWRSIPSVLCRSVMKTSDWEESGFWRAWWWHVVLTWFSAPLVSRGVSYCEGKSGHLLQKSTWYELVVSKQWCWTGL